ncbi:MAG: glycosyltransferase family 39 protein [Planctomycetota bacterium]|nr:glycosyltransferase family 39 protein [Planctomycetota bacterium]
MTELQRSARVAGWIAVALVGALAVAIGWDRGPDPLIDFGRELYVPWRLTEGDVLHRDIAWFNGPLGPWALEGWMRLFGVSLDAVQAMNAVVIALTTAALGRVCAVIAGQLAAGTAAWLFLVAFAVSQKETSGNFLFLAPYSHGITLGFLCGLLALLQLHRFSERGTRRAAFTAGAFLGLAFLSKAEIFLGAALGTGAMVTAQLAAPEEKARGRRGRLVIWSALGFTSLIGAAAGRFTAQIGAAELPMAIAGTWLHALDPSITGGDFYRTMRGTDEVGRSLVRVGSTTVGIVVFVSAILASARMIDRRARDARVAATVAFGLASTATVAAFTRAHLRWMLLPLVIFLPALAVALGTSALRRRKEGLDARSLLLLGFALFAVGLLPKILLAPMARQYGFVLTVPGAMLLVCLLVRWIPDVAARRGVRPGTIAAAGVGIVLVFGAMNAFATLQRFRRQDGALGAGPDMVVGESWMTNTLASVTREVAPLLRDDETLLVLPEGIMLNYQLRRRTPTRVVNFMPPELSMFEQHEIVAALEKAPPAVVVLVKRPTDIYGFPFFGEGYGEELLRWVRENYVRHELVGFEPFTLGWGHFGADILLPR